MVQRRRCICLLINCSLLQMAKQFAQKDRFLSTCKIIFLQEKWLSSSLMIIMSADRPCECAFSNTSIKESRCKQVLNNQSAKSLFKQQRWNFMLWRCTCIMLWFHLVKKVRQTLIYSDSWLHIQYSSVFKIKSLNRSFFITRQVKFRSTAILSYTYKLVFVQEKNKRAAL